MIASNGQVIDDFIYKRGVFSEEALRHYVNKDDMGKAQYHQQAAKEILARAVAEDCLMERRRLIKLVDWHIKKIDSALAKYEH